MSQLNSILFRNIDDVVNDSYKNTSGWFKKIQNSDNISDFSTDRHPILRVKDVNDNNRIPGAIRYNEQESVFRDMGNTGGGTGSWTNFNSTPGSDGLDGLNYRTVIEGNNLNTGDNYYPLFKNVVKTEVIDQL